MLSVALATAIGFASFTPEPPVCPMAAPNFGVSGIKGNGPHLRVLLGLAPDYPPYTSWATDEEGVLSMGGFSYDLGPLFMKYCNIQIDYILAPWEDCWTTKPDKLYFSQITEYVGNGIMQGELHGCVAYTHTKGERGLSLDFTYSVLGDKKTAGILTRLVDGVPIVSPSTVDYTGVKLGDVTGWAPTADTFVYNKNYCVEGAPNFMKGDPIIFPEANGNAAAIKALKNGTYDALYIYSDQIAQLKTDPEQAYLAEGFGTDMAYIQTGLNLWSYNGTTFAISKRGSGLSNALDPCIDKVVRTPEYKTICEKYFEPTSCIGGSDEVLFYDYKMSERTDSLTCADGYCTC